MNIIQQQTINEQGCFQYILQRVNTLNIRFDKKRISPINGKGSLTQFGRQDKINQLTHENMLNFIPK